MQQRICPECNKPLKWIPEYQRWYCKKDKIYPDLPLCPLCEQSLHWIPQYKRWYCYDDTTYLPLPPPTPSLSEDSESESPIEIENSPSDLEYMSKIEKANFMRNNPTPAERRMMEILNSSVVHNFPEHYFEIQSWQYGYTLDFYFPTLRLAIEIDGDSHTNRVGYDWGRDTNLERRGIRTLRASNEQVFNNPQSLADSLCKIIQDKITEQVEKENNYSAMQHNREKYRRKY